MAVTNHNCFGEETKRRLNSGNAWYHSVQNIFCGSMVRFPTAGIFLFTAASWTVPGPTKPPIQWVTGVLPLRIKRPEREADHSPLSSADVKEW